MMNRSLFGILIAGVIVLAVVVGVLANWGSVLNIGEDLLEFTFRPHERVGEEVVDCVDSDGCQIVHSLIYSAILLFAIVTGFAYVTLLERKLIAYFQQRVGPNRVGPWGFLQPAADGVKLIFKENIQPADAYIWVYRIAPILKVLPTLVVLAVIPMGPPIIVPWFDGVWYRVPLQLADPDVGVLWLLAITSLGTYGVVLAGWASNNKYAMLGGLRASAQMISYELSMGLALAVPVLIVGSMRLGDIIEAQHITLPFAGWFVFQNPLAAGILLLALLAEVNRAPFDLPEAEQELTAGYMTEYSGMKFALFMMAEYLGMIAVSMIAASMYFGGYQDGFGLVEHIPILGPLVMLGKVVILIIGMIWIRATLPRIRYDRLMMLGWKVLLPLAILAVIWTSVAVIVGEELGQRAYITFSLVMIAIVVIAGLFLFGRDEEAEEDDDYELDPVITGERSGFAYGALTIVGGLIAIPISGYNWTLKILDSLAQLGVEPETSEAPEALPEGDETAALPSQTASD